MLHIKKIKPLFTNIVTTAERFKEDFTEGGIIVAKKGDLKLWQKVIAVGPMVRDIKAGDQVMISLENYVVRRYDKNSIQNDLDNNPALRYNLHWVNVDDSDGNPQECLLLNDRDIPYSFEGEEKKESIVVPEKKVIVS